MRMNIPVGISDFEQIRSKEYYYIDKSGMIAEILKSESTAVTLITRPRRFGKGDEHTPSHDDQLS